MRSLKRACAFVLVVCLCVCVFQPVPDFPSLEALLLKWSQFHDGRDFFEFLMDSSKQLIGAFGVREFSTAFFFLGLLVVVGSLTLKNLNVGAGWIHILNLLFAQLGDSAQVESV